MKLDVNKMRKIAGLPEVKAEPLVESYDDDGDDGLSPSERALANRADSDLRKKGIKVGNINPDKDLHKLAANEKEKEETDDVDKAPAPVKKAGPAPATPKAEEKPAPKAEPEKKSRSNPNSKASGALKVVTDNPGITRQEFFAKMAADFGMGKNYANLKWQALKGHRQIANEGYILLHPNAPQYMLAENREMNQYVWVDASSEFPTVVCETLEAAEKLVKYMREIKNQVPVIDHYDLSEY